MEATEPNAREKASFLKENILPIQESGQLKWAESGSTAVNPAITLHTVSGHTESMFIPHIQAGDKTLVYCADLLPSMAHIPVAFIMAYDTRPLITLDEKKSFLDKAAANNFYLFFEHDKGIECCSLKNTERGIREDKTFKLAELF